MKEPRTNWLGVFFFTSLRMGFKIENVSGNQGMRFKYGSDVRMLMHMKGELNKVLESMERIRR